MAKFLFLDTDIQYLLTSKQKKLSGGAAVQSLIWAKALAALGHTIYVPISEKCETKIAENINLIRLYDENKGIRILRVIYYRLPKLYNVFKELKPDYIYQSIPSWMSYFIAIFCKTLNIRYIIRISNNNELNGKYIKHKSRLRYKMLRYGIKWSHCVLCQNRNQYRDLKSQFPNKLAYTIHNPIILNDHQLKPGLSQRDYIAWVAKIRYVKNPRLLYEIASNMPSENFYIAGAVDDNHPETLEYTKKLKGLENVNFKGVVEREDIPAFLSGAKFLLNTSLYEGFSNTYLEAMSVGTPVLTTENANPDGIIDGKGLGIVYRDARGLNETIKNISEATYNEMSDRCIDYVKKNHDHIQLAKQLITFLENNCSNNSSL